MKWICTLLASVALFWFKLLASDVSGFGNGRSVEKAASSRACCNQLAPASHAHSCCPAPVPTTASCCAQRAPSAPSPSAPVSNSGTSSRGLFLALHASLLRLDSLTAPRVPESSPAPVSVDAVVPVPLFLRHGTLLI